MPTGEDAVVQFKNFDKQYKAPFVVYADFECLTKPVSKASKNSANSYTDAYQRNPMAIAEPRARPRGGMPGKYKGMQGKYSTGTTVVDLPVQ